MQGAIRALFAMHESFPQALSAGVSVCLSVSMYVCITKEKNTIVLITSFTIFFFKKLDEVASNYLKYIKKQYPPKTTYNLDSNVMTSLGDYIKSLESEIVFNE